MVDVRIRKSIKELASEWILGENESENFNILIDKIKLDKNEFNIFIVSLENFFANTNDVLRKTSMKLLSMVIEKINDVKLSSNELTELLDFNIKKLKDVVCVTHAIKSLYFTIMHYELNRTQYISQIDKDILSNILICFRMENMHIPSYTQETRCYAYKIILYLVSNKHLYNELLSKQEELLKIILDSIDSEKDPRNILIIFELMTLIFKLFDKQTKFCLYVRSLFEILELYYPIEFTPPKNSPEAITSETLINALNTGFSSSDTLAENVIEMLRGIFSFSLEKISSTAIDSKIEVFKTYRAINKGYSQECFNMNFVNVVDNVLNELFNNSDEFLHIEGLITFKEIIERFSKSLENKGSLSDNETHILKNIEKIFEKCEDLLYSEENIKSCYDAKDVLVIICDNRSEYKERGIKISLKLISNYINDSKIYFLKNSSTILYFCLNKIENNKDLIKFLDLNINQIKTLVNSVLNKHHNLTDALISAIEIATVFLTKTSYYFSKSEVEVIFEKVFKIWNEQKILSDQEQHINRCLNEMVIKYPFLNNLNLCIKIINSNLDYIFNSDPSQETNKINELYKYLFLTQEYFTNKENSKIILDLFFKLFEKIFFSSSLTEKGFCFQESLLKKLTESIVYILEKYDGQEDTKMYFSSFVLSFLTTHGNYFKKSNFKNFDKILGVLLDKSFINSEQSSSILLKVLENVEKILISNDFILKENSNSIIKIEKGIKSCDHIHILVYKLKIVCLLLVNEKFATYLFSNEFSSVLNENVISIDEFYKRIMNSLDIFCSKRMNDKGFSRYINEIYGIILYQNLKSKNNNRTIFINNIYNRLDSYLKETFNSNKVDLDQIVLNNQLNYISTIINYIILINDEKFYPYISIIFDYLLNYLETTKEETFNSIVIENLGETNLFHFNKNIMRKIKEQNYRSMINLFVEILVYLKKYISQLDHIKSKSQFSYRTTLVLLSKYFKFVDSSIISTNAPVLLEIVLKSLEARVNIELSLNLLKKIIQITQLKDSTNTLRNLCEILIKILSETQEMNVKVDVFWCLYQIKLNNKFDSKFTRHIIVFLKPFLHDKKRLVRKYCGICNNIWTLSD